MQCLELVPALVTLLPVVLLVYLRKTAELVMVIVSAIQTAIFLVTAVRMSTVLLVIQKHKESIMLYIENLALFFAKYRAKDMCRCWHHIVLQ